jgi:hypothetical protein
MISIELMRMATRIRMLAVFLAKTGDAGAISAGYFS